MLLVEVDPRQVNGSRRQPEGFANIVPVAFVLERLGRRGPEAVFSALNADELESVVAGPDEAKLKVLGPRLAEGQEDLLQPLFPLN